MHQTFIVKYKGNTLVEVMVALALTSFAATLAVVIFLNIQKSTQPFIKIRALELAEKCLRESIDNFDYFDKTIEESGFVIKKKVSRDAHYYDCSVIHVVVLNSEKKKMVELQSTVYAE